MFPYTLKVFENFLMAADLVVDILED